MSDKSENSQEIVIDVEKMAMPIAMVISALIISIPMSLSIYFGLSNASIGGGVAGVQASECDETSPYSNACITQYAEEVGVNTGQFDQCFTNRKYDDEVTADLDYGTEVGVNGTPSLYFGENQGDGMRGFSIGPSVTATQIQEMISLIEQNGVDAAADYWREAQIGDIESYETQIRDYYVSEGQSGDQLEASVKSQVEARRLEIEESVSVQDFSYGDNSIETFKGNADASAVLMEFSDYECPYCQSFAAGVGAALNNQFVESGDLLFQYRDFPLESIHPSARKLANAARCAGEQGKYFEMHDNIFGVE